ncbi:N-acetylmuramoyl-L-alanine amidase [Corynebacterium sp. CCUG 71335]|uniref:N-acetylmuramoyl-L-alanine amidase n=1 Tax=Corynebacterium sp. CCUG 71335 TaxID=2823892 RepID=UPI00210BAFBB|nr:N-acetylmuramoyl-L-alanine amidase [Corynebacterium sp. CCUG 71335]
MKARTRLNPSSRRKTPVIAAVTSVALVAAGVYGGNEILKTQDAAGVQIEVTTSQASLSDAENVVVDDPAVATQGAEGDAARTVKEFTRDEEFSVFGLQWEGDRDIVAFVRAERADGSWSEWYPMDLLSTPEDATHQGTEPIYVEPTKKVQVSTANVDLIENGDLNIGGTEVTDQDDIPDVPLPDDALPDSDPVDLPDVPDADSPAVMGDAPALPTNYGDIAPVADIEELSEEGAEEHGDEDPAEAPAEAAPVTTASDLEAVFIDGGEGTVDGAIAPAQYNSNGMPKVITRASWGAKNATGTSYTEPTKAVTVHHTAGSNNYTAAQAPGIMRSMQAYHQGLGWQDLGYNAVVDKYGNIYEGRAGGLDRGPQGAHVGGFNSNTWGVSMMGDYSKTAPTPQGLKAMGDIIGWKAASSNFDPTGTVYLRSDYSFRGTKFPKGSGANFPAINAHRDFHYNDCPGDMLYSQLGTVRSHAKTKYNEIKGGGAAPAPKPAPKPSNGNNGNTGNSGTVKDSNGTETNINNAANLSSDISFEDILSGDPAAIAAAVGSVAGAVLLFAAGNDLLPKDISQVANIEVLPGMTLSSLRPHIGKIVEMSGSEDIQDTWRKIDPVLGQLDGVVKGVGGDEYAFFENGVEALSSDGSSVVMPEKIADAWLKQGMDLGPLGKPVKSDDAASGGDVRVDFERGKITYNVQTNKLDVTIDER